MSGERERPPASIEITTRRGRDIVVEDNESVGAASGLRVEADWLERFRARGNRHRTTPRGRENLLFWVTVVGTPIGILLAVALYFLA